MKNKIDFYKLTFLLIFAFIAYCCYQFSLNGRFSISNSTYGASILDTRTGSEYQNLEEKLKRHAKGDNYDSIQIGKALLK